MSDKKQTRSGLGKALFRQTTALAGVAAALAFGAGSAAAQTADTDEEVIVVTGSRIARPANITAPTQVTTIDSAVIEQSGLTNVADILRTVPSFGVPALSTTNSNFLTSGAGINTLALRNLGEDRTLVLVNGRRHVSGLAGTAAVDFNTIPVQMIERVEVITGGASAIYGSDALAGVINVILQDDFEGLEFGYQYGQTIRTDLVTNTPYIKLGHNFGDRGNITALVSYDQNGGVFSRDRTNTLVDDIALCALTGDPADCTTPVEQFYSGFTPYGRFTILNTGDNYVTTGVGPGGTVVPYDGVAHGFNRQQFRIVSVPTNRTQFALNGHYDFTPSVTGYFEAVSTWTDTISVLEPYPLAHTDFPNITGVSIDNPFMPQAIRDAAIAAGDTEVGFARRTNELGNRGTVGDRNTLQGVVGLRGDLGESWYWDAYYAYGRTNQYERSGGYGRLDRFEEALNAIDLDGDASTTDDIVCANPAAVAEGCVPINIFGVGSISPEAAAYVHAEATRRTELTQEVFGASIGGPIFQLPAGAVDLVGGFEYRKEEASDVTDELTQQGLSFGNQEQPIYGDYDVAEAFFEVEVPLLRDLPLVQELSVGAAYRYSDYSTVGNTDAYTGRISWQIADGLRFRAQYARAVRAPNIAELFAPAGENFEPVADPCNGVTAASTGVVAENCRSIPAIADRIAATGSFTLTQPEIQGTGGFTGGGNPNLDPETADSVNAGVVYENDWGRFGRFLLSVDYYQIEIDDLIDTVDRQTSVDFCFNDTNFPNDFCAFLVRDTAGPAFQQGELLEVNSGFINEGTLETSGVDVSANYSFAFDDLFGVNLGDLSLRVNYARLLDFTQTKFGSPDERQGEVGYSEHKVQGAAVYRIGPFSASWEITYLSDARPDTDPTSYDSYDVGSYTLHDMQVGYDLFDGRTNLYFGMNNVFDEAPPLILSGVTGNTTGTDTAADVYDPIGQYWYVGARVKF